MFPFHFFAVILFSSVTTNFATESHMHPLSDEFIEHINSKQRLWNAWRNFREDIPMSYIKRLMGSWKDNYEYSKHLPRKTYRKDLWVPRNFDARNHWRECPTLYDIRDQGSCGSCWAIAAVSAMTDRVCIQSNGKKHFYFSAQDVISCCLNCGSGCNGGVLRKAWLYSRRKGVVSGGGFGSHQGCIPYEIEPCEHDCPGNRSECGFPKKTPVCKRLCQPNYKNKYKKDKMKFKYVYVLNTTWDVMNEIYTNGPVTSSYKVYSDFLNYKDGVYYHVEGSYVGDHSIKILGWGIEKGVKYWLVANSWNTDWGNLNGFFKIRRGNNECGIEKLILAGV